MGARGPIPQPTKILELRGNPGKRSLNRHEPQFKKKAPKCPSWLDADARKEFRRLVKLMMEIEMLTEVDGNALATYCQAVSDEKRYTLFLRAHGATVETPNGFLQARPEVAMLKQAHELKKNLGAQFGLTPSARSRMSPGKKEPTGKELLEYMSRGKKKA